MFLYFFNDPRSLNRLWTCHENSNTPNFTDFWLTILGKWVCLLFWIFTPCKNLQPLGNSEVPDHLDFLLTYGNQPLELREFLDACHKPYHFMVGSVSVVLCSYHGLKIQNQKFSKCVVPENIHTLTMKGIGNQRGVGGSKSQEIPEGMGGKRRNFRPEGRKSIDFLHMSIGATYLL